MFRRLMLGVLLGSALVGAAGCTGEEGYERPLDVKYLTVQIFEPTCGAAQCHSTFKQSATNVFDTLDGVRSSLVNNGLVRTDPLKYDPDAPADADLIHWITDTDPFNAGKGRMPYDAPMPNHDVELLLDWIKAKAPGAQCNPGDFGGKTCTLDASGRTISADCSADWNVDLSTAIPCNLGCTAGVCQ